MKTHRLLFRILLALAWCLVFPHSASYAEPVKEYIKITKAGADRIPLVLKPIDTKKDKNKQYTAGIDTVIKSGLDFTGLFAIIKSPLNIITGGDLYQVGQRGINFAALSSVGAEVYAGGVLERKGDTLKMDMEVYDALTGKLLMRKLYEGDKDELRPIAHKFCADLVRLFTGKPSIFGSKIAFVSQSGRKKEIYLADFDGYGAVPVASSGDLAVTPALSSDGRMLAYLTYTRGRPDLHIKDLTTQKIVSVTKKGIKIDPSWRHGSTELATTFSFDGNQELYLVRSNGTIVRRLTKHGMIDVSPSFSPDGTQMAFVSSRHGNPQIFVKNLNSGALRRLTFEGKYNTQPAWSPVGDKIAFTTMQKNGEINIFIINVDGTGLKQLTYGARHNEAPSWSPDGTMIVFSSDRSGNSKLYVMNADGQNQRSLKLAGEQMQPCWSSFR
ncbi:Tol-Pal system beta propeller repeat protein TolB [Prosthecochloris marina]|uniref:Tol-Pal system beta propeller repeat protein TolB n=1 Tax=Prosthecochloris marina TaxID=2017681 RepID=A0A317T3Y0_9CHLB|nr:Tol-Pal system beta propeller repeat protein TolB [Prosthecochloris marina]PWW81368.1 Tol-Pal system beta propeller repeat protein TolB [Prosthecochloris marina]